MDLQPIAQRLRAMRVLAIREAVQNRQQAIRSAAMHVERPKRETAAAQAKRP